MGLRIIIIIIIITIINHNNDISIMIIMICFITTMIIIPKVKSDHRSKFSNYFTKQLKERSLKNIS